MGMTFLNLRFLIGVAAEARGHRVGAQKALRFPGVRAMAIRAIALRTVVLNLGVGDFLHYIVVARGTHFLLAAGEDDLAVLGRSVAGVAGLVRKRTVQEGLHQLGRFRFVGIVAGQAVGFFNRLVLMRVGDLLVLGIVAINAQRGCGL